MITKDNIIKFLPNRLKFEERIHSIVEIDEKTFENHVSVFFICNNSLSIERFTMEHYLVEKSILRSEYRDSFINEILSEPIVLGDFDVEDIIYTEEQQKKIESLRKSKRNQNSYQRRMMILSNVRKEYSESFHVGQRVTYKGAPGIITFKHADKNEDQSTRWSVRIKDTEYRYVGGLLLEDRPKVDLSYIKIDRELNKLPTRKLLRMFKGKRVRGRGSLLIKRILDEREHIRVTKDKIVIV